jgi:hypothetical protein
MRAISNPANRPGRADRGRAPQGLRKAFAQLHVVLQDHVVRGTVGDRGPGQPGGPQRRRWTVGSRVVDHRDAQLRVLLLKTAGRLVTPWMGHHYDRQLDVLVYGHAASLDDPVGANRPLEDCRHELSTVDGYDDGTAWNGLARNGSPSVQTQERWPVTGGRPGVERRGLGDRQVFPTP